MSSSSTAGSPKGTLTYAEYLSRVLPPARVNRGKRLLRKHRALLTEIGEAYGVQPRFIVALWGIESDFGRVTGGFSVLDALATLAFDGRRGEFFRGQLLDALRIVDDGHIQPDKMLGVVGRRHGAKPVPAVQLPTVCGRP